MMSRTVGGFNCCRRQTVTSTRSQKRRPHSYTTFLTYFCFSGQPFLTVFPPEKLERGFSPSNIYEKPALLSKPSHSACICCIPEKTRAKKRVSDTVSLQDLENLFLQAALASPPLLLQEGSVTS